MSSDFLARFSVCSRIDATSGICGGGWGIENGLPWLTEREVPVQGRCYGFPNSLFSGHNIYLQ